MLRKGLEKAASHLKGDPYRLDPDIPLTYLISLGIKRLLMYIKGKLLFRQQATVFIGSNVAVKCKQKFSFGNGLSLQDDCYIDALSREGITIGCNVSIGRACAIECSGTLKNIGKGLIIGNNVGFSTNCFLGCAGGIEIGDDTIIGNFVSMHSENHNFLDHDLLIRQQGINRKGIKIGNNCWIGAKVTILDGVEIGNGSIIAAGSVVTAGQYDEYGIYAGIPAKQIGTR